MFSPSQADVLSLPSAPSPSVYWNLVWYFSRLQLPTYLPLLTLWNFTRTHRELRKVGGRDLDTVTRLSVLKLCPERLLSVYRKCPDSVS